MVCQEQEKETFRQELQTAIRMVRDGEKIIIEADMNGSVGKRRTGYEVHGGHSFVVRNEDGEYELGMAQLRIHSYEHLVCEGR